MVLDKNQNFLRLVTFPALLVEEDGTIVFANHAFGEAAGFDHKQLYGKKLEKQIADPPEKFNRMMRLCLRSRDPVFGALTFRKPGGDTIKFPFKGMLLRPRSEDSPALAGLVSERNLEFAALNEQIYRLSSEIKKRELIEAKLQESEERFRNFFDLTADLVCIATIEGYFLQLNESWEKVLGYSRQELLDKPYLEFIHPDDRESTRQVVKEKLERGKTVLSFTNRYLRNDGSAVWLEWSYRPVLDKGITFGVARDITERKKLEAEREILNEQLAQSKKLESVGRLAGGIAHDYNNTLQVILGYIEMAKMEAPQVGSLWEYLDNAKKAAEHSAALTQQLLTFARKQAIEPKLLDLNEIVAGHIDLLNKLIGENIALSWKPQATASFVTADATQICQALTNLCANARDAIDGTGRIDITTQNVRLADADCAGHIDFRPGDFVVLQIRDDGRGIEPDALEHIFEPFFTTDKFGKSYGLGLATVHGIVTQNEGFIDVQSQPGQGACFRIYLPLSPRISS